MHVESGQKEHVDVLSIAKRKANEERRLREMTIPKKQKRLYDKIKLSQKKKRQEVSFSEKEEKFFLTNIQYFLD